MYFWLKDRLAFKLSPDFEINRLLEIDELGFILFNINCPFESIMALLISFFWIILSNFVLGLKWWFKLIFKPTLPCILFKYIPFFSNETCFYMLYHPLSYLRNRQNPHTLVKIKIFVHIFRRVQLKRRQVFAHISLIRNLRGCGFSGVHLINLVGLGDIIYFT